MVRYFAVSVVAFTAFAGWMMLTAQNRIHQGSCASFLLTRGDTLLVGHNLDDYIETVGLVVINPRNISKRGISWDEMRKPFSGKSKISWVSKYASVTYNIFGKEFPDGGMNETGFYVGEMTLFGTKYPKGKELSRLYHGQWIQYLLDNCGTVKEALASLSSVVPDGHCQWQFFFADRSGDAAVVEFIKGKTVILTGKDLPYKVITNFTYSAELEDLPNYQGFGGTRDPQKQYPNEDPRFRWCQLMLGSQDQKVPAVDYSFDILERMWMGNNKAAWVCDLKNLRMYFNTYKARNVRYVDLKSFDLSGKGPAMVLDFHTDLAGDVRGKLIPHSEEIQKKYVEMTWDNIKTGFLGDLLFKPRMKSCMVSMIRDFK